MLVGWNNIINQKVFINLDNISVSGWRYEKYSPTNPIDYLYKTDRDNGPVRHLTVTEVLLIFISIIVNI